MLDLFQNVSTDKHKTSLVVILPVTNLVTLPKPLQPCNHANAEQTCADTS
jgi:hypothetical protein